MQKSVNSPSHLIYLVLTVFVIINLFVPGEKNNLVFLLSQLIVYGFAGVHIVYLSGEKASYLKNAVGIAFPGTAYQLYQFLLSI